MQVITDRREVSRGNVQNEHNFTIKASAKAFNILSSNLYSNKPLAIIRELCCNAYDSHVAAGCADRAIELVLPTRLNGGQLIVKDFGLGLDHEGMIDIYTKFFESTKTNSNDFVGQLGLGSKSPFSMFKTFSVEARKNGVKRVYTAYLNEEGIPTIAKMSETDTDEGNGVMVTMHVKPDDYDKFYQAARQALMYFNPKPIVSGSHNFQTFEVSHGVGGSNWKVRESDYWARMHGPHVVQGFVVYPIDGSLVEETAQLSQGARVIANMNVDFWLPIGSVDVAPSREALSYDKRTVANIAAAFEQAASEMRDVIQKDLDSAATAYEAGCKRHHYETHRDGNMRTLFTSLNQQKQFLWKGQPVTYKHEIDITKIRTTVIARASSTGRKLMYSSRYEPTTIDTERVIPLTAGCQVIIDDVMRGSGDIIKQFLDDSNNKKHTAVVLRPVTKDAYNEKEIKGIVKMLGDAPAKKVSELPYKPTTTSRPANRRTDEQRMRFTGFNTGRWNEKNRTFSVKTWEVATVDIAKGGFYLPMDRHAVIYDGCVQTHLDDIITASVDLGLITRDQVNNKLFGFNKKEVEKAPANWVNFFDYIRDQFEKKNMLTTVTEASIHDALKSNMADFNRTMGAKWPALRHKINDGKFKAFVDRVRMAPVKTHKDGVVHSFMQYALDDKYSKQVRTAVQAACDEWEALLEAHGLLTMISWWQVDGDRMQYVIDYINALDIK